MHNTDWVKLTTTDNLWHMYIQNYSDFTTAVTQTRLDISYLYDKKHCPVTASKRFTIPVVGIQIDIFLF